MKLDPSLLRYMSRDEFRVLTAIEMGMRNHELVPTTLIPRIAALKGANAKKIVRVLHRNKLVRHENQEYDGFRLTYQGYDYLALNVFMQRGLISEVGRRIGVGKEADVYEATTPTGDRVVIKFHRLGRVSFRHVNTKRDYLQHRSHASWLYLSRLAAQREFAYLSALYEKQFPVPTPLSQNRHAVLMQRLPATPLSVFHPSTLLSHLSDLSACKFPCCHTRSPFTSD